MSSIKTFCVRWIALIALTGAVLVPVSRATADQASHPASGQEASPAR